MRRNNRSQKAIILDILKQGIAINPRKALNICGCFRLAAVIHSLKKEGYEFVTTTVKSKTGNSYAEYKLA